MIVDMECGVPGVNRGLNGGRRGQFMFSTAKHGEDGPAGDGRRPPLLRAQVDLGRRGRRPRPPAADGPHLRAQQELPHLVEQCDGLRVKTLFTWGGPLYGVSSYQKCKKWWCP